MKLLSNVPVNLRRNACLYRPVRISVSRESCVKCTEGEVRLQFSRSVLVNANLFYLSWLFCNTNKNSGKHSHGYLIVSNCVDVTILSLFITINLIYSSSPLQT